MDCYRFPLSDHEIGVVIKELRTIPVRYLSDRSDCNSENDLFIKGEVEQLKPSTHPVFRFKKYRIIVKVMMDWQNGHNEEQARRHIRNEIPFIPAQFVQNNNRIIIIMPDVNGVMLSEIARTDFPLFYEQYEKVYSLVCEFVFKHRTTEKRKLNNIIFGGRSLSCLQLWLEQTEKVCGDLFVYSQITKQTYHLKSEMHEAAIELSKPTNECCLFSGDINLHNVLFAKGQVLFSDFEHWGYFDVNYLFSIIIGSIFAHCSILFPKGVVRNASKLSVQYSLREEVEACIRQRGYVFYSSTPPFVNFHRIKAFILARWYYRIMNIVKSDDKRNLYYLTYLLDVFKEIQMSLF